MAGGARFNGSVQALADALDGHAKVKAFVEYRDKVIAIRGKSKGKRSTDVKEIKARAPHVRSLKTLQPNLLFNKKQLAKAILQLLEFESR